MAIHSEVERYLNQTYPHANYNKPNEVLDIYKKELGDLGTMYMKGNCAVIAHIHPDYRPQNILPYSVQKQIVQIAVSDIWILARRFEDAIALWGTPDIPGSSVVTYKGKKLYKLETPVMTARNPRFETTVNGCNIISSHSALGELFWYEGSSSPDLPKYERKYGDCTVTEIGYSDYNFGRSTDTVAYYRGGSAYLKFENWQKLSSDCPFLKVIRPGVLYKAVSGYVKDLAGSAYGNYLYTDKVYTEEVFKSLGGVKLSNGACIAASNYVYDMGRALDSDDCRLYVGTFQKHNGSRPFTRIDLSNEDDAKLVAQVMNSEYSDGIITTPYKIKSISYFTNATLVTIKGKSCIKCSATNMLNDANGILSFTTDRLINATPLFKDGYVVPHGGYTWSQMARRTATTSLHDSLVYVLTRIPDNKYKKTFTKGFGLIGGSKAIASDVYGDVIGNVAIIWKNPSADKDYAAAINELDIKSPLIRYEGQRLDAKALVLYSGANSYYIPDRANLGQYKKQGLSEVSKGVFKLDSNVRIRDAYSSYSDYYSIDFFNKKYLSLVNVVTDGKLFITQNLQLRGETLLHYVDYSSTDSEVEWRVYNPFGSPIGLSNVIGYYKLLSKQLDGVSVSGKTVTLSLKQNSRLRQYLGNAIVTSDKNGTYTLTF